MRSLPDGAARTKPFVGEGGDDAVGGGARQPDAGRELDQGQAVGAAASCRSMSAARAMTSHALAAFRPGTLLDDHDCTCPSPTPDETLCALPSLSTMRNGYPSCGHYFKCRVRRQARGRCTMGTGQP